MQNGTGRFEILGGDKTQSVLWLTWLGLLLSSFVAGFTSDHWWSLARLDLRTVSCLVLVLCAWRFWRRSNSGLAGTTLLLVAIGMTLGFYGDSHVGTRLWWPPMPSPIVGGIVFFGLGHVAYVLASVVVARQFAIRLGRTGWFTVLVWQVTGLIGWAAIALTSDQSIELRLPTLAYTLLVAGTPGLAFAVALKLRKLWVWAVGAGLFFASDLLLAWQLFHGAFTLIDEFTWICYGFGQMMIVFGAGLGTLRPKVP